MLSSKRSNEQPSLRQAAQCMMACAQGRETRPHPVESTAGGTYLRRSFLANAALRPLSLPSKVSGLTSCGLSSSSASDGAAQQWSCGVRYGDSTFTWDKRLLVCFRGSERCKRYGKPDLVPAESRSAPSGMVKAEVRAQP
jgi:hypothetical protein